MRICRASFVFSGSEFYEKVMFDGTRNLNLSLFDVDASISFDLFADLLHICGGC